MRVLGMQSGTSMDGVDVALLEFTDARQAGGLLVQLAHAATYPYPDALRADLGRAVAGEALGAAALCRLDTELGQVFGEVAATVLAEHSDSPVQLVASLGQTLYHWVADGHARGTLQLGQPAWIAERVGLPVVAGFRPRDVAAGGQGAPLAPVLDALLLRGLAETHPDTARAAVNIGGIANITVVAPDAPVLGYDSGPGNALLDAAWQTRGPGGTPYDVDAALARTGTVDDTVLAELAADRYYGRPAPKSTGKEYFTAATLAPYRQVPLPDLLATLTELTAWHVTDACRRHAVTDVLLSGGGAANPLLVERIAGRLRGRARVRTTAEIGVPIAAKEAVLTGLLGWLTWHGVGGNVPSATGARAQRVLGSITPGRWPPRLPEPRAAAPAWLRVARDEGGGR